MKRLLLCVIISTLSLSASATISQVQSKPNWACSGTSCAATFTSNPASRDLVAVWTFWQSTGSFTASAADNLICVGGLPCNTYLSAVGPTLQPSASTPTSAQIFYAKNFRNPSGLSVTVTVTFSGSVTSAGMVIVEYSGLDIYYPLDSASAGYSTSGNQTGLLDSGTVAPANANLLVFGGGNSDTGSVIVGSGFTLVQGNGGSITEQMVVSGNNTLQRATACIGSGMACSTTTTGNWVMQTAVFRDASWTVGGGWNPPRFAQILDASQFPGADIGDQVNHAYAALTANGGHIVIPGKADGSCYSFSTPIILNTSGKYVLLEYVGSGGLITSGSGGVWSGCLNYTGTGAAITLDYATSATDSLSPIHGLKNIVLVNNFCGQTGCTSSATGILICGSSIGGCTSANRGIQSATMENVSVSGFSVGYQTQNFYSDPVLWLNPHFFANGTAWVVGDVSTQTVYGGYFTGNATAVAAPGVSGPSQCNDPTHNVYYCYPSEISFYGTSFVDNSSWVFDYSNNQVCCAKLDLFGVHLEQYMCSATGNCPSAQRILQGKVDFLQSGGVAEDDNGASSCGGMACNSDYWYNAQGSKFTLDNVEYVSGTDTPSVGVVKDSTSTRVKVSGFVKTPTSLPCASLVGGTGAAAATVQVSEGNTGTSPCTWVYESPISVSGTTATMASGAGSPVGNCTVGSTYTNTSATSTSNLFYVCYPANTWNAH